ncbi:hypothetical protein [uncultured Streptomyces sp.]|uniref:hypothetical protein n=1 Tax=uncultured Streptomyces sp. TaxID=174707 RepID=UPI0026232F8F|nr:hypothetical protein [uncultured Streptomyces sp.]
MSLPGADELFRTTGGMGLQSSSPAERRRRAANEARVPAPGAEGAAAAPGDRSGETPAPGRSPEHAAAEPEGGDQPVQRPAGVPQSRTGPGPQAPPPAQEQDAGAGQQRRRGAGRGANRRPSGRERHDEKITVYVSAEELMDLEHARLVLRGEHGLAVDRGRIVREAVAVVLADLESRGDASILVRRLRGR